ncbi:two component transcriptional regulator, LytTR family [Mucilaginibacter lappiensis]|uniref:DNA-binding LytR/AlgR family response regulator n=1 Tax=Mucilaginibacter lappiensis TaxID=354630 RepID=A0ABR6PDE1_9SPHI|nr:LytTR family DNA-binding domain-containing protein [Mucilaginibacter lappiensis]MBB6107752.1 DNA-binding LytR/AlgR family response regulator [Mucilaginibacter lappiensis]SIP98243.1 two component transcriptional regulator, LytTR family [Mucilaginibacter lappiensis]
MSLKCYVIDDERHSVEMLIEYISKTDGLELQGFSTNPLTALNEVTGANPPDITFLDVEMPELSGMEFAGMANLYTRIIFTTSFQEFALEAFEKEAFDFLLKPISYARFRKSVQRVQRMAIIAKPEPEEKRDFFFVKTEMKGKMVKVTVNDILYIEGAQNYIKIHLLSGQVMPYLTITEIEQYLPMTQFSRIHQSFIINTDRIRAVEQTRVTLENGTVLNLGRFYKEPFLEKMNEVLLKSRRKP